MGTVFGIRLSLHATWFLVLGLVTWASVAAFDQAYPRLGPATHLAMGLITGVVFFASLTAHELAHSVVARRFGIRVRGITLFLFGGVAEIEGEVPTPAQEFAVALVGPATSVTLGGAFGLAAAGATALRWPAAEGVLATLAVVNLGVTVFNLVPGLPLDGGRLLRAALWYATRDHRRATRIAAAGGRVVAVLLVGLGATIVVAGDPFGLWYLPMGGFLWLLARSSGRAEPPKPPDGALALTFDEGNAPQPGS